MIDKSSEFTNNPTLIQKQQEESASNIHELFYEIDIKDDSTKLEEINRSFKTEEETNIDDLKKKDRHRLFSLFPVLDNLVPVDIRKKGSAWKNSK